MDWKIIKNLGLALAMTIATVLATSAFVWADNCEKAQIEYERGVKLSDFEGRIKAFQLAVKLCPSFPEAHVNLADAYEKLALSDKKFNTENLRANNRYLDMAIREYQTAMKYKPQLFEAHLGLAENYFRIGLYAKAEKSYKDALKADPNHSLIARAQTGLQKVKELASKQKEGFKTAKEIVAGVKQTSSDNSLGRIMGFENRVVALTRLLFNNILFNEWSHKLDRPETFDQLKELGKALASADMKSCKFVVEGHTDNRGGLERNQVLSDNRAAEVKKYLVDNFGIASASISAQGFGYSRPRVPNDSRENMLKNRRVELIIIQ
jgi:outer membrane protein OmpA-like peptidoglycan-associated protein